MKLQPTHLLAFERDGHLLTPNLLPPGKVHWIRNCVQDLHKQGRSQALEQKVRVLIGQDAVDKALANGRNTADTLEKQLSGLPKACVPFLQNFNLWRQSDDLLGLLRTPALAGVAAQLLGVRKVRLYQDSIFVKRPGDGPTNWHSDLTMAPLDTNKLVTVWIPLQPLDSVDDGGTGLVFASGSHRDVALCFWHDPRSSSDLSWRYKDPKTGASYRLGDATWVRS